MISSLLKKLAKLQYQHTLIFLMILIVFTIFIGSGMSNLSFQSDMSKEMPQQLEIYQLNDFVKDKLSQKDTVFIVFQIDDSLNLKDSAKDIRDPRIINYLINLEEVLVQESLIDEVVSAGTILKHTPTNTLEEITKTIEQIPDVNSFFNKDYKVTFMLISADIGTGEEKIVALKELIDEKIAGLSTPPGAKIMVTGNPSIRVVILNLLKKDSVTTILIATLLIFILLIIMQRSLKHGIILLLPLITGLIWTLGLLGWLDMKISIATAGLGAMILGLGVEYAVFIFSRFKEERKKGTSQEKSIETAVSSVGSAILGSGLTTIGGFLALRISFMPMLSNLGTSLAIGIGFCLLSALCVTPIFAILEEDFIEKKERIKI